MPFDFSLYKHIANTLLLLSLFACTLLNRADAQIYKYQDATGKWQYSDQKPVNSSAKIETLSYQSTPKKIKRPSLELRSSSTGLDYVVTNPYFAPIQALLRISKADDKVISQVISANSTVVLHHRSEVEGTKVKRNIEHEFYYVLGSPEAKHSQYSYLPPLRTFVQ